MEEAVARFLPYLKGSFSLVVMSPRKLIAARDPWGIRPLSMGKTDHSYIFASETCALDAVDAEYIRDIKPGEIVCVDKDGVRSDERLCTGKEKICIFEYIYFARPDSMIDGVSVYEDARRRAEGFLQGTPRQADIVIRCRILGIDAAINTPKAVPYGVGLIKTVYRKNFTPHYQQQHGRSGTERFKKLSGQRIMVDDSM